MHPAVAHLCLCQPRTCWLPSPHTDWNIPLLSAHWPWWWDSGGTHITTIPSNPLQKSVVSSNAECQIQDNCYRWPNWGSRGKKKDGSRVLLQELMPVLVVFSLLLGKTGKIRIAMRIHKAEIIQFLTCEIMAYLLSCVLCEGRYWNVPTFVKWYQ